MNIEDKFTKSSMRTSLNDFKANFNIHPGSRDLQLLNDVDAVKMSIVNIIRTSRYDRPFQPTLGCYINDLLFENMTDSALSLARRMIIEAVQIHEPRANIINVIVSPSEDENGLYIHIVFTVLNSSDPITLDIALDRIR